MDDHDFPKKFIDDVPEHQQGDPELYSIEVTLRTIRLQLLAPLASLANLDQDEIEDTLSALQTELVRVKVQLEALDCTGDEKTALQFAADVLAAITNFIEPTLERIGSLSLPENERLTLSKVASSLKNLLDMPESIIFMINAAKGEQLGLDATVVNRAGEFGQLSKKTFLPARVLDRLTQAHDIIVALDALDDQARNNFHVKPAGEHLTIAMTTIGNAFDFEALGGRLQEGFRLIGARLYSAVEQLTRIFNFPQDTFYQKSGTGGSQLKPTEDHPKDSIDRLLGEIEFSMALLRIAQKIADRVAEKP